MRWQDYLNCSLVAAERGKSRSKSVNEDWGGRIILAVPWLLQKEEIITQNLLVKSEVAGLS